MIGLFCFNCPGSREPVYAGKPLSEWLRLYKQPNGAVAPVQPQEAADAVRQIGTNALPLLVTWVQEEQEVPPWRDHLFGLAYHWNFGQGFLELIAGPQLHAAYAIRGFIILGEAGRGAVPGLARVAREGKQPSCELAIEALSYLGKDALPPILSMSTNSNLTLRRAALASLSQMRYLGTNARPAIVFLIQCLHNPDLARCAADTLGGLHLESGISIPALIECTRSTDRELRTRSVSDLEEFGPEARAAVPRLTELLRDPEASVRYAATNAVRAITSEVVSSAP